MQALVPDDFDVPEGLSAEHFRLVVLDTDLAEVDYEAVMSSRERLRSIFAASTAWPGDDMTLQQDIADLENHRREFDAREAFAYSLLSVDAKRCIGCLYIEPPRLDEYDCEVYLWLRDDTLDLDQRCFSDISKWLSESWPFDAIAFPGRDIPWDQWPLKFSHPGLPD